MPFVGPDQPSSWLSPVLNQLEQDGGGGGSIVVRAAAAPSRGCSRFSGASRPAALVLQIERWAQCGRHLGARRGSNLEHPANGGT